MIEVVITVSLHVLILFCVNYHNYLFVSLCIFYCNNMVKIVHVIIKAV